MDKVILMFMPDLRESLCFKGIFTLEECFDKIRETCEMYKDDLRYVEFMAYTEDEKPMFNISGCVIYQIKGGYEELEPTILEIYNTYFEENQRDFYSENTR